MTSNTNIGRNRLSLDAALLAIPKKFRSHILKHFGKIREGYLRAVYDASGINVGKFCEAILRYLQYELTDTNIPFNQRILNLYDECSKLGQLPKTAGHESLRLIIPRATQFLYTLRNKRGIGHIGGDVDENKIDSATAVRVAEWVICELIRLKHGLSLEEAQEIVDGLSVRILPDVWEVAGRKVVLKKGITTKQKALLLLYSAQDEAISTVELCLWAKYSNLSVFRSQVIKPLDKENLIYLEENEDLVFLSPLGALEVEKTLL